MSRIVATAAALVTAAVVAVPAMAGSAAREAATPTPAALAKRLSALTNQNAALARRTTALEKRVAALPTAGVAGASGPQGPAGPQGQAGAQGPAGPIAGRPAGGDLAGSYPNPQVAAGAVGSPEIADGSVDTADLASEPWRIVGAAGQPAFQNSWVNANTGGSPVTLRFRRDALGVVHVAGQVSGGTVAGGGTGAAFTLPPGYRPAGDRYFPILTTNGNNVITPGWAAATPDGGVRIGVGNNIFVALDFSFMP